MRKSTKLRIAGTLFVAVVPLFLRFCLPAIHSYAISRQRSLYPQGSLPVPGTAETDIILLLIKSFLKSPEMIYGSLGVIFLTGVVFFIFAAASKRKENVQNGPLFTTNNTVTHKGLNPLITLAIGAALFSAVFFIDQKYFFGITSSMLLHSFESPMLLVMSLSTPTSWIYLLSIVLLLVGIWGVVKKIAQESFY